MPSQSFFSMQKKNAVPIWGLGKAFALTQPGLITFIFWSTKYFSNICDSENFVDSNSLLKHCILFSPTEFLFSSLK